MKAELIAHFFLTTPPYRTINPGILCRPTNVAAANCHALLPLSSHFGEGTNIDPSSHHSGLFLRAGRNRTSKKYPQSQAFSSHYIVAVRQLDQLAGCRCTALALSTLSAQYLSIIENVGYTEGTPFT